ncbi:MAG TPA: FTR1 family protein, partial [Thermomicrobiales bacterium]|nr:FTR1 family protein [Thermomicrobiales bacterium]
ESTAQAAGYWAILAPLYERQFGTDQRAVADGTFAALAGAGRAADTTGLAALQSQAQSLAESFRAAPLSAEEQARRAGQLLLYLSLVPVEYGRGVKQGQVASDIEIQEAQTFLDGARAAFTDLRLPLSTLDAARTTEAASRLDQLESWLHGAGLHQDVAEPADVKATAANTATTLKAIFPSEWERRGGAADFDVVSSLLDQMEKAVAAKQYQQAESARLEAYAIFDAGPEKHLLAFAPHLAQKVEVLFWQGDNDHPGLAYLLQGSPSSAEVRQTRLALDRAIADSQQVLGTGRPAKAAIVFNAATIVFREGLEGVLILASLLASMVGANRRFKRPLAIGALGAFGATAVLFVLARTILLSLGRYGEKLEAIVSLVAIGILLLVMNWFFHKVYWTKWIAKHHDRRRVLIGGAAGQVLGLVVLGFTSVFREGAETVLFLQALVLDAGTWVVIEGTLLGLLGVAVVGALVFVMQKKLPHKKMLMVTGVMIATVLVTMVGTTIHVLQVVGWAPINPVESLQVPFWAGQWFGVYGTWEGILAQGAALIFVVGSYYLAEHAQERRRTATVRGLSTAGSRG